MPMTHFSWSVDDHRYMAEAINLAKRGKYTTDPNPRVGCVLVKDGQVIGRGWHVRAGEGHAEVNALAQAGKQAAGATAYVTLEPCSHYGRTPPCSKGLIDAGVSRVVAAMQDPNPQVAGNGFEMLKEAGVEVSFGLLQASAESLNPGFIKRMKSGLPYVRLKMATSLDGRTAMASGESQWITGAAARSDVQRLRAQSSAIISGIDTVIDDDASLTVRPQELGLEDASEAAEKQPLRVILDSRARLPRTAKLLAQDSPILWVVSEEVDVDESISKHAQVEVLRVAQDTIENRALDPILKALADRDCNEVLVEAGATLAASFISQGYVDELVIYMASKLMGSQARPLADLPFEKMAESVELTLNDLRMVGQDIRLTYLPKSE